MSLKAKVEAVIYAAEEPVTLAQLATLFAPEALEWKAEQEAARAALAAEEAAEGGETLPLIHPAEEADEASEPAAEELAEAAGEEVAADGAAPEEAVAVDSEAAQEAEARRVARLRDREVKTILRQMIDELIGFYASDERGVEIREIAGGYRMATKPECHDAVRMFVRSLKPALKLSLPALETLAVIAYKQPVTAPEVNEIRGVDSSGVFGSLLARKLIATAGRKQVIGRPILYKTTREFLLRFGLKDVSELPSMEEFEKLAAIELEEPEASDSSEQGAASGENPSAEFDEFAEAEDAEGQVPTEEAPLEIESNNATDQPAQENSLETADITQETAETADRQPVPAEVGAPTESPAS